MPDLTNPSHPITRRRLLAAGLGTAALATLAGCTSPPPRLISPTSSAVTTAEEARRSTGRVVSATLNAQPMQLDLAGKMANTWAFGSTPAPTIRVSAGDTVLAQVTNQLPDPTSVHWHGVALRNDMDGVPPLTQKAIAPDNSFAYKFIAEHPGTYWFHPHVGTQLDRGLYGALIVEDPHDPLRYDEEWVVVLDDWLDGVTATPDQVLKQLSKGMASMGMDGMLMRMGNMLMGTNSPLLGGDTGDVYYPEYLINGRPPADPETFTAKPGSRIRIRFINAGGDTAFRVALGGHALTITHTDGYPVEPKDVDSVLLGMGERYDVIVTAGDGVFPLVASAEGKDAAGFALLRTAAGTAPAPTTSIPELVSSRVGTADQLATASAVRLRSKPVDRTLTMKLSGDMSSYDWAINNRRFDIKKPLQDALRVRKGERVRLKLVNDTKMWHPMHLHGHTYQHPNGGPRKDTSIVLPGKTLQVEFDADNPGQWLSHCHNIYHGESGMMTVVAYER
ncbi:multicopper oxidase family protein [Humibacter ginsenosidimutans]|jgi:FtsP/CotA-like multicopper oxidase with cupredoxin domain|uniref:Multicopper oxidase family protein n=2 Tax=Humibacter ginsenosidimutans TaxID=2599293 RepID=A0A5B8M938_9MICO|nr:MULTISPECIES: multicopper oxidase family protein [Humibacter]QDZ15920.1 multicopper oxidase family protein [Humibacter ginsenosidimutans]